MVVVAVVHGELVHALAVKTAVHRPQTQGRRASALSVARLPQRAVTARCGGGNVEAFGLSGERDTLKMPDRSRGAVWPQTTLAVARRASN